MRHVTHMNESCPTHEWVVSQIWISRVTHKGTSASCLWHDSSTLIHEYTHEHIGDLHLLLSRDAYTCVTWWHDSFTCVPWLIRMCSKTHSYDMTHSHVWHADMTHPHLYHDSLACFERLIHLTSTFVPWLIRMCRKTHSCDMTHSHVWHGDTTPQHLYYDSFACLKRLIHVTWLIHRCDMVIWLTQLWSCSVLQRLAACYSVLQCVAVCCSVLQCVAVCCSGCITQLFHDSFAYVKRLIHVTCLIHRCDMVTWIMLVRMYLKTHSCDMTHS